MMGNRKLFIYNLSLGIYVLVFLFLSSLDIEKKANKDGINSDSIITLGTPFYYELETREAYTGGRVYLQNSKDEYKTFYLENDGISLQYRSVRDFVSAVNDVKYKAEYIHLMIVWNIVVLIFLYDAFKYSENILEFNLFAFIFLLLFMRYGSNQMDAFYEYVELINNADLIFESIVVPIS